MTILCTTLLPNDRAQPFPAETGTNIKQTPVTDKITDAVAAPVKKLYRLNPIVS